MSDSTDLSKRTRGWLNVPKVVSAGLPRFECSPYVLLFCRHTVCSSRTGRREIRTLVMLILVDLKKTFPAGNFLTDEGWDASPQPVNPSFAGAWTASSPRGTFVWQCRQPLQRDRSYRLGIRLAVRRKVPRGESWLTRPAVSPERVHFGDRPAAEEFPAGNFALRSIVTGPGGRSSEHFPLRADSG